MILGSCETDLKSKKSFSKVHFKPQASSVVAQANSKYLPKVFKYAIFKTSPQAKRHLSSLL